MLCLKNKSVFGCSNQLSFNFQHCCKLSSTTFRVSRGTLNFFSPAAITPSVCYSGNQNFLNQANMFFVWCNDSTAILLWVTPPAPAHNRFKVCGLYIIWLLYQDLYKIAKRLPNKGQWLPSVISWGDPLLVPLQVA